jgi:hypothetical protein
MAVIINLAAFHLCWLACVLAGAIGMPWLGVAATGALAAYHLNRASQPGREALFLLLAGAIGALWDGLLVGLGWLVYPSGLFAPWLAPTWIIALWVTFATTFNVSLRWLRGHWFLAGLLGAVGGPLAFYAGEQLGGVTFPDTRLAMTALALGWSLLMPLLLFLAERLDGVREASRATRARLEEADSRV